MSIELPNLDDRTFDQLLREANQVILQESPAWTDTTASDPGRVILDVFAHLTELMLYRLNRVPDKAYREFLRLIGVQLYPPTAARTTLKFSRAAESAQPVDIPRGTRVTVSRAAGGAEPPVFVTTKPATIAADAKDVEVLALHCELVEGELVGKGTGLPGLVVTARRPPIVATTHTELDLTVGVEARPDELGERAQAIPFNGKAYRIWRAVENFVEVGADPHVYLVDRLTGTITFAPAIHLYTAEDKPGELPSALAAVPPADREIRLWYSRGGGQAGDVPAETLTTLKDPIPGVLVTNPSAATGGQDPEALANALVRGPRDLHSLNRAVTARDFESIAEKSVARARAFTRSALWTYAPPGTVEVLLVPHVPDEQKAATRVDVAAIAANQTEETRANIQRALDERRPLGTTCVVNWAHLKTVGVHARLGVRPEENFSALSQRVRNRLYQTITPLRTAVNPSGWGFGQALHASDIYYIAQSEPSVRWVDRVLLRVEEVPDKAVRTLAADVFQPQTWYAGSQETLFRSMDDGRGWEPAGRFPGEQIELVRPHGERAGLVAIATRVGDAAGSHLYISQDCGENWKPLAQPAFHVADMAWTLRGDLPVLLMATDVGLYELELRPGASPIQVLVDPSNQSRGFYAVAAAQSARGDLNVAVAAQGTAGVYLSQQAGRGGSFTPIGLVNEDIRVLAVQMVGVRTVLWAGVYVEGMADPGKGAFSWDLTTGVPAEGWVGHSKGWNAGSCRAIAFQGDNVLAGTHHAGVLRLQARTAEAAWESGGITSNLPARELGTFHPISTVAADRAGRMVMAGVMPVTEEPKVVQGIFRSTDGLHYEFCSSRQFTDVVTLPETWLFCSGVHELEVVNADEKTRD